ncbi:TonB-dependent receptor [Sphingomonas sp. KR1UV-12]|uniref:TonB-dependent receptor n=1 Tax=Sphingomonas aurea TaxID=3063994 RepID=A0ABT9EJH7_9SPHN|nr:TonB-dependent receptor [Sphingomonas sp. KR1UV-12]MDP1027123.1 TonB-dependent receptor [Sphingomonas sp. KR1UV-12]
MIAFVMLALAAPPPVPADDDAIVVTGERVQGSAIGDAAPVAVLNGDALRSLGATSMKELLDRLKPLGRSAVGGEPVLLLNGRRISGWEDLRSIPPEAIERTEILPESEAGRFGYPPTVRLMNLITKKHFRSLQVQQLPGITTEGGGETNYTEVGSTRIDGPRRASLSASYLRLNPVFQSQRDIVPEPGMIDLGPYRTLIGRTDQVRSEGTLATVLGKVDASANLSMEAQRSTGLNGLPSDGVAYLPGSPLRQRSTGLTLHGGTTVQGNLGRWLWNVTGSYDRVRGTAVAELGVVPDGTAAQRPVARSRTATGTLVGKAVMSGALVQLPAGPAQLTVSADYARSTSSGRLLGSGDPSLDLQRTTGGASVNASVPIASPERGVLAFVGRLSANGMIGVSDVSDYGRLFSSNLGLNWAPLRGLELNGAVNRTQTPPAIALLTAPTITAPNTPFFDFATGTSPLVTTISGGNPALDPERRSVTTLGVALSPIRGKELRLNLDYVDTRIRNQATVLAGTLPAIQAAFPDRFLRDEAGVLTQVDVRLVNLAAERERKVQLSANFFTRLGPAPPPPPAAAPGQQAKDAPPPAPPKPRPTLYMNLTGTLRLADRVTLRPGTAPLDLLGGATLDGTGGRPRWELEGNAGLGIGPVSSGLFARVQGPTRVRGDLAAADLRFSGRTWLVLYSNVDVERIAKAPWAKRMSVQFTVENLLNDRIDVRDRTGAVPNRFQGAFLDPIGRSVRLGVRKLF